MAELPIDEIARGVRAGDKTQIARALNMIENKRPDIERQVTELLGLLSEGSELGHGHRVGLTGLPGVGDHQTNFPVIGPICPVPIGR